MYCFKVMVKYENDLGGVPAYPDQTIGVSCNHAIRTAADAVAHCLEPIGTFTYPATATTKESTKTLTRIHHKDPETGERFSITECVPVRPEPFPLNEMPRIRSLDDAPKKTVG